MLVDAVAGDYHLQAGSPCIDAGTATNAPNTDYEGTTRPQGAAYDIGAYEYQSALAVDYLSALQALPQKKGVLLRWTSANEQNNRYFEIQRMTKNRDWQAIYQQPGKGNSSLPISYNFLDTDAPFGKIYYRLKQVDDDGRFTYSSVVSVWLKKMDFACFPNPTTGHLSIILKQNEKATIKITDLVGHIWLEKSIHRTKTNLDLTSLPEGLYWISLDNFRQMPPKLITINK